MRAMRGIGSGLQYESCEIGIPDVRLLAFPGCGTSRVGDALPKGVGLRYPRAFGCATKGG